MQMYRNDSRTSRIASVPTRGRLFGDGSVHSHWAEATAAKAARRMDLANMADEDERRVRSSERVKRVGGRGKGPSQSTRSGSQAAFTQLRSLARDGDRSNFVSTRAPFRSLLYYNSLSRWINPVNPTSAHSGPSQTLSSDLLRTSRSCARVARGSQDSSAQARPEGPRLGCSVSPIPLLLQHCKPVELSTSPRSTRNASYRLPLDSRSSSRLAAIAFAGPRHARNVRCCC